MAMWERFQLIWIKKKKPDSIEHGRIFGFSNGDMSLVVGEALAGVVEDFEMGDAGEESGGGAENGPGHDILWDVKYAFESRDMR